MIKYNLFLDDFRLPRDPFLYTGDSDYLKLNWILVRNYEEFCSLLEKLYQEGKFPEWISFDHDLADEHYVKGNPNYDQLTEKTGYHCAQWLIEFVMDHPELEIPRVKVHSMNPCGKKNIESLFQTYQKIKNL